MKIFNRSLLTAAISAALLSTSAIAQDNDDEIIEEVIVTGSRIKQDPLGMRAPVQILSAEDIDRSGQASLADFVQRLPIAGSAINKTNNSSGNLGFPPDGAGIGAGAAEIDLRYLQSKRVLVLVDGRRWVRGSSASGVSGAVDLNTIPANAIKSIEVLQDGASAVYGSDAIGGVLNIITQDDYDMFKVSAYGSQYASEGDGETQEFDIAWGASSDVARAFLDVSFFEQKGVDAGDRAISRTVLPGGPFDGASSGTPSGRYLFVDPRTGLTVNVTPERQNPTFDFMNPGSGDFHDFGNADRFNYQPFNYILTPNKRVSIFGKSEYDLTDDITFRMLASYNNRESQSRAAPEPLFFGPSGDSTPFMLNVFWPADHPHNPFGVDLGPDNIIFFGRRPIEAGPRIFDQTVDTYYLSAGLDGAFNAGDRSINWDLSFVWAQNEGNQVKTGAFNARRIFDAMGPPEVCATLPGCVPLNIVGEGSLTQEMLDYVTYIQKDQSQQEMRDITFNITGSFGGLEAGDIGWALGYEFREEKGFFIPDPVVAAGETAGVPSNPTNGKFEVDEIYGEVNVPLLAGRPGAERLELSVAFRSSDYDLFGSDTVGKIGLNWEPVDGFLVRTNFSEGLRAPNIGELFNTGSRFDSTLDDPCANPSSSDAANCAALGLPADLIQLNPQISVTTGGNPGLIPETADTFTMGFAWDVAAVDNWDGIDRLTVEANYYDIEIEDAIQAPNGQDVINGCVRTLSPVFCDQVTRAAGSGQLLRVDGVLANIGGIETTGFDFAVRLDTTEYEWGRMSFEWVNTILDDYIEITAGPDGPVSVDRAGTELGSPERGFVETKSTLNVDWYRGDWDVRASFRYLSSLDEACGGIAGGFGLFEFCSNGEAGNEIDSRLYVDAQVTWAPSELGDGNWAFQVGADNLFDEDVPFCSSCDLNSWDGTLYPTPGVVVYARATYSR